MILEVSSTRLWISDALLHQVPCQCTVVQEKLSEKADELLYIFLKRVVEGPAGSCRLCGEEIMDVGFVCVGARQQQVLVLFPSCAPPIK